MIGASDTAFLTTTNAILSYTHENLLGSRVQSQVFSRNYSFNGLGIPFDGRDFFCFILQTPGESEHLGGRLQIETPFNSQETLSLLWGVDYVREESSQNFTVFDPVEFDASGGLIFRKIDEIAFVPSYRFNNLSILAQLQWELSGKRSYAKGSRLAFSGGARYVNLDISTDDYTTFDGNDIEGGSFNTDDIVFNGVYDSSSNIILLITGFVMWRYRRRAKPNSQIVDRPANQHRA